MQSRFQLSFGARKNISLPIWPSFLSILANISASYCVSIVTPRIKWRELENYAAGSKLRKIQIPLSTEMIHQDQVKNLAQSSTRLDYTLDFILSKWFHGCESIENCFLWEHIGQSSGYKWKRSWAWGRSDHYTWFWFINFWKIIRSVFQFYFIFFLFPEVALPQSQAMIHWANH